MRGQEPTLVSFRLALLLLLWGPFLEARVVDTKDGLKVSQTTGQSRELLQVVAEKIAGGADAPCGRFPYMASLRSEGGVHKCGGVLIHPQWILTAAHCVGDKSGLSPNMIIAVGGCSLNEPRGPAENGRIVEFFRNLEITLHPNWTGQTKDGYDIALVQLRGTSANQNVSYAKRASVLDQGERFSAIGFGRRADGEISDVLQFTNTLSVLANHFCDDEEDGWGNIIMESMVCASGLGGSADTCQGDSGGPLLIAYEPDGEIAKGYPDLDTVVGITSFGEDKDCGDLGLPGVYTRVSSFADWIERTITGIEAPGLMAPETVPPSESANQSSVPFPTAESQEFTATMNTSEFTDEESVIAAAEAPASPSPEVTASPKPEVPSSQEPKGPASPEPEVTTSPDPEAVASPEPEVPSSQEPEITASPEPEVMASQDAEVTPPQEPELAASPASCLCSDDGVSGGVETGLGGCHRRLPKGILMCYVASDQDCAPQFQSIIFPGAVWEPCMDDGGLQELPKETGLSEEDQAKINEELLRIATSLKVTEGQMRELILGGADLQVRGKENVTILHLVAAGGTVVAATALVEAGADVDATDDLGWTPLHQASAVGETAIVEFLVETGADVSVRGRDQWTPRDSACSLAACPPGTMGKIQAILSLER